MTKRKQPTPFDLLFWLHNKEIGLQQFRAQMKDIGITDENIDIYLDGDAADMDEDQLLELKGQ